MTAKLQKLASRYHTIFKKLNFELARYFLVGVVSVSVDAVVYYLLTTTALASPGVAKRISFVIGSTWAFLANKFFTFRKKDKVIREPVAFAMVYLFGFIANGYVHDLTLEIWNVGPLSFILATGLSTVTNYLGQKFIVFAKRK